MPKRPVRKRLEHRKKSKPKEKVVHKVSTSVDTGEAEAGISQQSGNIIDETQISEKQCEISSLLEECLPSTATDNNMLEITSGTSITAEGESLPNITTSCLDNSQGIVPSSVSSISLNVQSPDELNTQSQAVEEVNLKVWSFDTQEENVTHEVKASPLKLWRSGQVPPEGNLWMTVQRQQSCDSPKSFNKLKISVSPIVQNVGLPAVDSPVQASEGNAGDTFADSLSQLRLSIEVPRGGLPIISSPKLVKIDAKDQLSSDAQVSEMEDSLSASTMKSPPEVLPSPATPANVSCIRPVQGNQQNTNPQCQTCHCDIELGNLPSRLMSYLMKRVPKQWGVRVSDEGAYVMLFSLGITSALQRVVYASFDGNDIQFIVHNNILPSNHEVYQSSLLKPRVPLSSKSVEEFATVLLSALHAIQDFKMCVAIDNPNFVEQWPKHPNYRLDENSFHEETYEKTLRTANCELLVARNKKRCRPCARDLDNMNKREARRSDEIHPNTRHDYLSPNSLRGVLKIRKKDVRNRAAQIKYLSERFAKRLESEHETIGVDEDLHEDLASSIENADDLPKAFWEEQKKAFKLKDQRGVRWHPFMLRWALHLKSLSSTAYRAMRDSGFIKLPSERTLYEYTQVNPSKKGIQKHVVKRLGDSVQNFDDDFQKYHVVMFDEVYLFKNVVYNKGTGEITGYVQLDNIEKEMSELEKELENEKTKGKPVATTMLTYLVKGVANGVKGVVACFTASGLNVDELHSRTWDVIWHLEMAGVKVIALVGDGSAVNHSFFQRHPPFTITDSGIVFDTLNIFSSDDRPIFFFNDPPHLLKTIRNCFANSGAHKMTRLLKKNGQIITWQTIITIFKSEESKDLRYCHKLSNMHVHLNSYSIMKVYVAAQVMSRTVAAYIEKCKLPQTSETVHFIRAVNDFFDCINGAHSSQARKTNNQLLAKYEKEDDPRFELLLQFLAYLKEWENDVNALKIPESHKIKMQLSPQTKIGIERTIRSFITAVKFLLRKRKIPGQGFIIARAFQQDSLLSYYSQQRACGGSSHPVAAKFLENRNILDIKESCGAKRHRGKTQPVEEWEDVNNPLPKRPKTVKRKLDTVE